ncbi:MAG: hypothetical protein QNJ55_12145 [Xenococcus sp. MO_188.B8]|nr:hypothetical protein [Xenococcus sp. MO_188.B8]
MQDFRQEIRDAQAVRSDLLKWKLIISAALGAVGLGLESSKDGNDIFPVDLAFCLIPFVCAYVDLLCYQMNLRMFVINIFFKRLELDSNDTWKNHKDIYLFKKYEQTCDEVRKDKKINAFILDSWALTWSSLFLSILVIIIYWFQKDRPEAIWFLFAGVVGILMALITGAVYKSKVNNLQKGLQEGIFDKIILPADEI